MAIAPITLSVAVPCSPAEAFETFTARFAGWWPKEFSWSGETLAEIGFEPREGGFAFERGPNGFTVHWGTVTAWRPPGEFALLWQISMKREPLPDPARASQVRVHFRPEGDATRLEFEHSKFERHGEGAEDYRDALSGAWPGILERFARACRG